MCWDMADSYGSQRTMAACVAVDKLVRLMKESIGLALTEQQEKARKVFLRYLKKNKGSLGERFTNRILTFLNRIDSADTKDFLRKWAEDGTHGIVGADLKSWDMVRHPVAHGELLFDLGEGDLDKLKERFKHAKRVETLVNKLVLSAMGYQGGYYDHAEYCWKRLPGPEIEPSSGD